MSVEKVPIVATNKEIWPIKELPVRLRIADVSFARSPLCDESNVYYRYHDDEPIRVSWSYQESVRTVQFYLEKYDELRRLRENTDWTNEKQRQKFFQAFYLFVIRTWTGKIPNTKDLKSFWNRSDVEYFPDYVNYFLQKEVVHWLLLDCVEKRYQSDSHFHLSNILISFVAMSAKYKYPLETDEIGMPLLLLTTALHRAARLKHYCVVEVLFEIYNEFYANYTEESGLSHFHVACMSGCVEVVEKFLELGQNPNVIWQDTGDTPLHLALKNRHKQVAFLLLRSKANPNLFNNNGWTSLYIACLNSEDNLEWLTMILEHSSQQYQPLRLSDADKWGRTPLELAVAYHSLNAVELLLDRGADFSGFVFPAKIDLVNKYFGGPYEMLGYLRIASSFLAIIEILKAKGCRVPQRHAWKIKTVFEKIFSMAEFVENWYNDIDFVVIAGDIMITRCLSLYNLVRSHPKEAARLVNFRDYYNFIHSSMVHWPPERCRISCLLHLSQMMWDKLSVHCDP